MPPLTRADSQDSSLWRVQRLEEDFVSLSSKIDVLTSSLNVGLSSIGTQIAALQVSMPDHYMPRREYDVTTKLLEGRIKVLEDTQSKALWLVLGTLLTALINVALLAFKTVTGHA